MAACLSEDLTCSVCLALFTEPVVLSCGHSFCRDCISASLDKQPQCPNCRAAVDRDTALCSSHVLKSLVERTKEAAEQKLRYRRDKEEAEFLCPEHDEKLKLFCITDQRLICVICRDSQKHEAHRFKPVSEAAALVKTELQGLLRNISEDTAALETLAESQQQEINTTKERAGELKTLVSSKFKFMYEFLKKKEKELKEKVKLDEKEALQKMIKSLDDMKTAKAENKQLENIVTTAINVDDNERFLKMWSEQNEAKAAKSSFRPRRGAFKVEKSDLTLGPYDSHLQMFVWKEMVQVLEPREERLSLRTDTAGLCVSQDQSTASICPTQYKYDQLNKEYQNSKSVYNQYTSSYSRGYSSTPAQTPAQTQPKSTQSSNTFAGQHYWEVYVGPQSHWELGLPQTYLKYKNGQFEICTSGRSKALEVQDKPQKIGIYLNCPRKELCFYNADGMKHLHTESVASSLPVSAYFGLGPSETHDPLVVYRY